MVVNEKMKHENWARSRVELLSQFVSEENKLHETLGDENCTTGPFSPEIYENLLNH